MLFLPIIFIQLLSWGYDAQYIRKKSKNVHTFFGYIAKNPKMCTAFLKIFYPHQVYFQKIWKRSRFFHIFPEKVAQQVYCQNFEERSGFAELFQKNFLTTGILPKNPKVFSRFSNFFEKVAHRVYFRNFWKRSGFWELFSKNFTSLLMTIRKSPPKGHTPLQLFRKFLYLYLPYHRLGVIYVPIWA